MPAVYFSIKTNINNNQNINMQVLEIWNIDSFEGGSGSKSSFLSNIAIDFEKQNKGTYFMVKNMSEQECELAISQGQYPAMFSYGTAIGKSLKNYLQKIDVKYNVNAQILETGKIDSDVYAVGWCQSRYVYISSQEVVGDNKIADIALSRGFVTTNKKGKQKITYSVAFGEKINHPSKLLNYNNEPYAYDENNINKTAYNAYCDYVEGKSQILLGTIRDYLRIENRVNLGKWSGAVYEPADGYCDLVQYVSVCKLTNQAEICEKFINYLLSASVQTKLANICMLPCTDNLKIYENGVMNEIENAVVQKYQNVFN